MNSGLLYCGITQDRVPVGIRERVHADAPRRRALVRAAGALAEGALVLSTCERFEVYAAVQTPAAGPWIALLAREFGFSMDALAPHLRFCASQDAARHLLRVAAGLESRLLGEPNILRQLRAAYLEGLDQRELGPLLSALGRAAVHAGKRVRRETALASAGQSLISLAVAHLSDGLGDSPARPRQSILLGTGMLAREALSQLVRTADTRVIVVSRAHERACEMAERFGAEAAPLSALPSLLSEADALLACSHAPQGFLIDRRCIGSRRQRCLRIVDLGLPRNVDPDAASMPGVRLTQLERLHGFTTACPSAIAAAEAIVGRELQRFEEWRQARVHCSEIAAWLRESSAAPAERRALHARIACLKAQVAA